MFVRLLEENDQSIAKELWGYAFEKDEPFYSWYFDEVFNYQNSIGVFSDDQLISYLQLNPYTLHLNGNDFETSYVVGIITAPSHRNKGSMKLLLPRAIEEMNNKNHFISILMPFDTTFYQPYGWELCYSEMKYEVPIHILKGISEKKGDFHKVREENSKDLNEIYNIYLKNYHGYVKRNYRNWETLLKDLSYGGGYGYILYDHGDPIGYIFYLLKDQSFITIEMAYKNYRAQKYIFGFILGHSSQVNKVIWPAPINDSTYLFLRDTIKPEPTNVIKIHPFMCGRVINVKKALSHCKFPKDINISFTMKINDSYCPWNNKNFRVKMNQGVLHVIESNDKIDIECTINTFSQLFFGAIDIYEGLWLEKIILYNPSIVESLSQIFKKKNNFIHEFF